VERHTANLLYAIEIAKDGSLQGSDLEDVLKDAAPQWCCDRHRGTDQMSGPLEKLLRITLLHRKMYPEGMRFPQSWTQQHSSHEGIQVDSTLGHGDSHAQSATPDKDLSSDLSTCAVIEKGFKDLQACVEAGFTKLGGTQQAQPKTEPEQTTDNTADKCKELFSRCEIQVGNLFRKLGDTQEKQDKKLRKFSKDLHTLAHQVKLIQGVVLTEKSNPELTEHLVRLRRLMASLFEQNKWIARGYSSK